MNLSPEQKQAVSSWVAAGDNLSVVQKKLSEQFKLSLTYRDVRFLVDDLGLELKNATPKADVSDVTKAQVAKPAPAPAEKKGFVDKLKEKVGLGGGTDDAADDLPPEEAIPEDEGIPANAPVGSLTLEVDRIMRPGTVVSGTVTFSDGVSGKWGLDQYGRLMLDTGQKGYQPSAADVQTFQRELQMHLQRQGY
ncbi:hypothetical protein ESB00_12735 [Oleiharenicola lentus]|jgi:hypothetical protein|uniref:Uncharacterized protein n=1 Tax=Oleiharenicola lentus TaxID=2508720 RepID=A0A4Q1CC55_9BACT|nr:hypothetical protein [Oleiharenicola lentus]RXK56694.1 hypothetical protein ESB00_12735 [Oleiharenicola lentus]